MQPARNYIAESQQRIAPRFAATRTLLATWTSAYRLWLAQPSDEHKELMQHAHAAYKAEQERALTLSPANNPA